MKTIKTLLDEPPPPTTGTAILAKVLKLQGMVSTFPKDKQNPHFRYGYASAQGVSELVQPALTELGLVAQTEISQSYDSENKSLVVAHARLTLWDVESGQSLTFSALGSGTDTGDKHAMKANTAALKYATIMAVFGSTGDDPEADAKTDAPQAPAAKPASVRSNRPAPAPNPNSADVVDMGDGAFMATVPVQNVWFQGIESKTKPGKFGPGSIVDNGGVRFHTYEADDLAEGKRIQEAGERAVIIYKIDSWGKNAIIKGGVSAAGQPQAMSEDRDAADGL